MFAAKPLIFAGDFLAAAGGEMRSNYFKNTAPVLSGSAALIKTAKELGEKHRLKPYFNSGKRKFFNHK